MWYDKIYCHFIEAWGKKHDRVVALLGFLLMLAFLLAPAIFLMLCCPGGFR